MEQPSKSGGELSIRGAGSRPGVREIDFPLYYSDKETGNSIAVVYRGRGTRSRARSTRSGNALVHGHPDGEQGGCH